MNKKYIKGSHCLEKWYVDWQLSLIVHHFHAENANEQNIVIFKWSKKREKKQSNSKSESIEKQNYETLMFSPRNRITFTNDLALNRINDRLTNNILIYSAWYMCCVYNLQKIIKWNLYVRLYWNNLSINIHILFFSNKC